VSYNVHCATLCFRGWRWLWLYLDLNEVAVDFREKSEPKIYFNRRKFNRMDWDEQHEYNKKLEERKTVYSAITEDGGLYDIPKIVYNHFIELNK
jgi:hypothetical protein